MPKKLTIRIDDKPDAVVIGNSEMAAIRGDEPLIKRLRKGSKDARNSWRRERTIRTSISGARTKAASSFFNGSSLCP